MPELTPIEIVERLMQWGVVKPVDSPEDRERRHLEQMAATIAAGIESKPVSDYTYKQLAETAVSAARAIQAEVRREGGADD
jgi:hypothetical protein